MSEPSQEIDERIARLEAQEERLRSLELLAERGAPAARTGRDWNAYAAVIASFIGLLALAVSGYTAYVQRQQLRAQVWPHLQIKFSTVNPQFFATNQGTGPARITAVRVTVGDARVKTWSDVENAAGFSSGDGVNKSDLDYAVLAPGKDFTIIQPKNEQSRATFEELFPRGKHPVVIVVCYCSVLDDCWFAGSNDEVGPREGCPISAAERFKQ